MGPQPRGTPLYKGAPMWTRKAALAIAPPIEQWPTVDRQALDEHDRELFDTLHAAIDLYVENHPISHIVSLTGVSRGTLTAVAKRCLAVADDGRIMGFRALI